MHAIIRMVTHQSIVRVFPAPLRERQVRGDTGYGVLSMAEMHSTAFAIETDVR